MKISVAILALFFSVTALDARGEDGCAHPRSSYDATYCMCKLFVESDKELNEVYKELSSTIKPDQKKKLVQVQRKWLKFRDSSCESSGTINVDCNYKVNKARTDALRDRLRECKTGHCREDLIVQEDWKSGSKE